MTYEDATHEANKLTVRTGIIHIPVHTPDRWIVQPIETSVDKTGEAR
jgi:hypothetical protein